jgi:hypothetical protein
MRVAVQLAVAAVEAVEVADPAVEPVVAARACGTNRATEAQKGVIFMIASVGRMTVCKTARNINFEQRKAPDPGEILRFYSADPENTLDEVDFKGLTVLGIAWPPK